MYSKSILYFLSISSLFPLMAPYSGEITGFSFGINVYYLINSSLLFYGLSLYARKKISLSPFSSKILFSLFLFVIWAVVSSLSLPFLFEGVSVFEPRVGLDYQARNGLGELVWSYSNLGQAIYLCLNFNMVLASLYIFKSKEVFYPYLFRVFLHLSIVILFLTFWQFLSKITGIYFPQEIFFSLLDRGESNQTLLGLFRITATMNEPSALGAVLCSLLAFNLVGVAKTRLVRFKVLSIMLAVAVFLTISSTGLIVLCLMSIFIMTKKGYQILSTKKIHLNSVLFFVFMMIFLATSYFLFRDIINIILGGSLLDKASSVSFNTRTEADLHGLRLFFETYGVGVGLGSNRPSSFIVAILSNLGFLGLFLCFFIMFFVLKSYIRLRKNDESLDYIFSAFIVYLIAKIISGPDISSEFFWICLSGYIISCEISERDTVTCK